MALFDMIKADLKTAMKSHDDELKTVLRSVLAVIDNARIDGKNVNDDNVIIAIISKAVKERETNAAEYERIVNGEITADKDAVERAHAHALIERNEADALRKYLPASASQEQIDGIGVPYYVPVSDTESDLHIQVGDRFYGFVREVKLGGRRCEYTPLAPVGGYYEPVDDTQYPTLPEALAALADHFGDEDLKRRLEKES